MLEVPPRFKTVEQVASGLDLLHQQMQAARDLRGLFVTAYVATTNTIGQWIKRGVFSDNEGMSRHVVAFANEYRNALVFSQSAQREKVPLAWRQSFEACDIRTTSIFQCLMLGINAHMNRDLPYAVVAANIDLNCRANYDDHRRINEVLRLNMPAVRARIAKVYGDQLPAPCRWTAGLFDIMLTRRFRADRDRAWKHAHLLTRADSARGRAEIDQIIERHAELSGESILKRGGFANGFKSFAAARRYAVSSVVF